MKRMSPTAPNLPRVVSSYVDAGRRGDELFGHGVNVCVVNTDEPGWGGCSADLDAVVAVHKRRLKAQEAERKRSEESGGKAGGEGGGAVGEISVSGALPESEYASYSAVVCKDLLIHPLQIADAVERGADGVLLMVGNLPIKDILCGA